MKAEEFKKHLVEDIIPFWNKLKDEEFGGFYGSVAGDGTPVKEYMKGVILNSRILWFYSRAYRTFQYPELLAMADHAYRFLVEHCYDRSYGGVYWAVKYNGEVEDSLKHTYNLAFAIYALSSYYDASEKKEALELAYAIYSTIESKCRDEGGYLEAYNRDFTPTINHELSENGVIAERTMNTLLHVLEAYSELFRVNRFYMPADCSDEERNRLGKVEASLKEILSLFKEKVYNPEKQICEVFFDHEYRPLIDLESYGHDIETAWLIDRGVEVIGEQKYADKMTPITKDLTAQIYKVAFDGHSLHNECEKGVVNTSRIWWVQAETVVGFLNGYQMDPAHTEYLEAAKNEWEYIKEHVLDKRNGMEWYWEVDIDGEPTSKKPIVEPWKCPYHNGRMCFEVIKRADKVQID